MTVVEFTGRKRICVSCGNEFVDPTRSGGGRSYCDDCNPRRDRLPTERREAADARQRSQPRRDELPGEPLTLEHFRAWCGTLEHRGGEPFELEDWEAEVMADVFDALAGSGVREIWLIVPEGNGKSTIVALLVLYVVQYVPDARVPVAAAARDQAQIIWMQGERFIRYSNLAIEARPGLRELRASNDAVAKIYAGEVGANDGTIPFPLEVIDELHRHKTLELYRTWAGKLDKEDAVLVVISTAGEPGSDFEETRAAMRAVDDVRVDGCHGRYASETGILHEWALPEDGDPEDLQLVKAANPSSRITVAGLARKRAAPAWSLPHWKRLTCNQATVTDGAGLAPPVWAGALAPEGRREIPPGVAVWYGADFAWVHDTTAIVPLWVRSHEFRLLGQASILIPPPDGSQLDVNLVKSVWLELVERNPALGVVMDMSYARDLSQWLSDELGVEVIDRKQTNPMAVQDFNAFLEGLRNKWLWHCGDPGLTQHVLNARTKLLPGGDTRFVRPAESRTITPEARLRRVIDALSAASMVNQHVNVVLGEPKKPTEPLMAML